MESTVKSVRRITAIGMALNLALSLAKAAVGTVCSSQALVADALHSLSDLATDFAVIFGVRYWEAPADENHPYGHGKIQALVTLFIALMLMLVVWKLATGAVASFCRGPEMSPGWEALMLALASIVVKEALYRATDRVAVKTNTPALRANAWHHRSDALSSIPVAAAVALAHFFPFMWWADPAGALAVAVFIAILAWEIARPALQELIDAQIDSKSADVERIALSVAGVSSVHCCRARRYGGAFQAELHIQVDSSLSIVEAHRIAHRVEDAVTAAGIGVVDATIHVEPALGGRKGTGEITL